MAIWAEHAGRKPSGSLAVDLNREADWTFSRTRFTSSDSRTEVQEPIKCVLRTGVTGLVAAIGAKRGAVNYQKCLTMRRQRNGDPNRRATRARRSPSEPVPVMSIPLSMSPSMSARMISARLSTLPLVPRMSVDSRSRWRICRSKSTTETLDHVSLWTGGRPLPALEPFRDDLADPAPACFFVIAPPPQEL